MATIATHDLARVSFPLTYACRPAEEVSLLPLGWAVRGTTTARGLLDHLEANRPSRNKKAKSLDASAAALSRYVCSLLCTEVALSSFNNVVGAYAEPKISGGHLHFCKMADQDTKQDIFQIANQIHTDVTNQRRNLIFALQCILIQLFKYVHVALCMQHF